MEKIKVTTKLIITCIVVSLFFLLAFEIAYNKLMYKDYSEIYNEMLVMENKVDKLIKINLKLLKL